MKNKLLATLALLALGWPTLAQTTDSVNYQNQLGIIASPQLDKFFTANRTLPVGLIYKRQIKPDQAVRLSALGAYRRQTFTSTIFPENLNTITTSLLQVMAGYEWQKELSKRWILYYGSDAGIIFNNNIKNDDEPTSVFWQRGATRNYRAEDKFLTLSIRPMAGIKLKVFSKIYLSAETTLSASFNRHEFDSNLEIVFYDTGETTGEHQNGIWKNYSLQYLPISNIQFIYHF